MSTSHGDRQPGLGLLSSSSSSLWLLLSSSSSSSFGMDSIVIQSRVQVGIPSCVASPFRSGDAMDEFRGGGNAKDERRL